jgi:hypothetical protein
MLYSNVYTVHHMWLSKVLQHGAIALALSPFSFFKTYMHMYIVQVMEEENRTEVAKFGAGKPTRTIISGTDQLR